MIFDTFPPADGTYKISHGITLTVRPQLKPTLARAILFIYIGGLVNGHYVVHSRSLSCLTEDNYYERLADAIGIRDSYLMELGQEVALADETDHRRRAHRIARAKITEDELMQAYKETRSRVIAPTRRDVRAVLDRVGAIDPVTFAHYKQFQWIAS